ncbi:tryptophan halogenase family protein [Sphaerisporangium aureirubrum]|uniref:Tryptophan halogenase family protein n=1 Tax=Sphaerisporangium aureirubrum TaxID=1544736 RepID=A0ABW1NP40_9ACTN
MASSPGNPMNLSGMLDGLAGSMTEEERALVRSWLAPEEAKAPRGFGAGRERVAEEFVRPSADDPRAVRTVGVIGGGTAGYLTALALRAKRPWLDVTLVESSTVPIIGVGEATVPLMVTFLHSYLGIDPQDFYREVQPTWKLGIKFNWGPDPEGFMAPFDWGVNSVGVLGSLAERGNINAFTLQSLMMMGNRTPVFGPAGEPISLMKYLSFAYHLDNERFVRYLTGLARARGVGHLDAKIADVVPSGPDWIDHLVTTDGQRLDFDFYVDCSGFRSLMLGKALNTRFHSYSGSLFTDSAVTGNIPHGGLLKPYTSATTMDAGWCWNIPTRESDHLGYVYSSAALSDEEAADELARRFPGITPPRFVRFRVGRHESAWRGNMMAIGNSYGFVEPLESSGLLMITQGILALVRAMPASWADPVGRDVVNSVLGMKWDEIRWFLSVHYRFNTRLDTPFWREARERTDVSGLQPLLDVYAAGAPLRLRDRLTQLHLSLTAPTFYGLEGIDCVLLGQKVPTRLLRSAEPIERWRERKAAADVLVRKALPQAEALALFDAEPRLHDELVKDRDGWVARSAPTL